MVFQLKEIWRYRYFWFSLVKMDLMTRYRKSVLGIGWSLVYPLAMTGVFCLVFSTIMNSGGGDWRTYSQNTLAGMVMWEFLKTCLSQGCTALTRSEAYIRQAPLPYAIYTLRTVLGNSFHFMMSLLALLLVVIVLNKNGLTMTAFMIVPAVLLAFIFAWSLATLTAFATAFFHDITHMVEVITYMLFFLTPIIYGRELMVQQGYGWFVYINPFAVFIELLRAPLVQGVVAESEMYLNAVLFTAATFGLAVGTIAWLQRKVIFHL